MNALTLNRYFIRKSLWEDLEHLNRKIRKKEKRTCIFIVRCPITYFCLLDVDLTMAWKVISECSGLGIGGKLGC